MNTKIKRAAAALCSCTLLAACLTGCGGSEAESVMDPTVAVEVQNVRRGSIQLQGTYVGSVSAGESVNVIPLVQGATVESVNVSVGSEVKEGQVLAKLDSTSADLTAQNAQAAYNSALAQAQSTLGGQWKTNIYSADRGVDQLNDSIDNLNDSIDDLKDSTAYKTAEKQRNAAKGKRDSLNGVADALLKVQGIKVTVTKANQKYTILKDKSTKTDEDGKETIEYKEKNIGDVVTVNLDSYNDFEELATIAKLEGEESGMSAEDKENVQKYAEGIAKNLKQYNVTVSGLAAAIAEAEATYTSAQISFESMESQVTQLETQRDAYETQRDTAEGTLDITQGETYNETVAALQAGLAQAQVGLDSAAYQQSLYTLTAPITGTVESVGLTKDGMASASSIAFTISNKDTMVVTFYVAEDVRDELTAGQPVTVSRGGNTYSGAITEIGNAVDMQKGLFKVKATIYDMPDIASGVTASITTTCHSANNVVVIPCDAVYYENGSAYVFVARDGVAVKTPVETGIYNDTDIAITSGLIEGQQVITTWSANLMDGSSITIPGQENEQQSADSSAASAQN